MKSYTKPSMTIAMFGMTDIATASDTYTEDAGKSNVENAQEYLKTTGGNPGNVLNFVGE